MDSDFDYGEFTSRNFGFVNAAGQRRLRRAAVLVVGVGGMGGAAVQSLARMGVGHFALVDGDRFEVSNLNRQVFASLDTVGIDKVEATAAAVARINPEAQIERVGPAWPAQIDQWLERYPLVINGMDDIAMGVHLYRRAAACGATVVDAYTAPLPSVKVVEPRDPRPEQRLRYPSLGLDVRALSADVQAGCLRRELEYVLVHSSAARHVNLRVAREVLQGQRHRMSFAPMVITTGNLMAFEVAKQVLDIRPRASARGYFLDPWTMRIEHPRNPASAMVRRLLARRALKRLLA